MNRLLENITKYILICVVSFGSIVIPYKNIDAAPRVLYEQKSSEMVTKGVTYELSRRLTDLGWVDVNVLKVNIEDANITLAPVQSKKELGLKEPLVDLLYTNGAVAGVNSDFFGMKGTHSVPFGTAVTNGTVISSSDDRNIGVNDYSTFFIDKNNMPFMDFLKINFEFLNNGVKNIDINAINKAGDQVYAMKFDKNGGENTSALDSRFPNLVKIVVEDNVISYISLKGEVVTVPENGYIIVINEQWFDEKVDLFSVGQTAEFRINSSIDLNNINTAISGGAKILDNGSISPNPGALVSPTSRQPRTALGITEDGKELIFMVVDGRTHSIGATQDELGYLLLNYGAYNAMNFDGGGSSTMVVKTLDDPWLTIKNTLSEGSQRKVINGLGVFNKAPVGNITTLVVKSEQDKIFKNTPAKIDVFGYDEYYNKVEVPYGDVVITSSDTEGKWDGQYFYPSVSGEITLSGQYGELTSTSSFKSLEVVEIFSDIKSIGLEVGETISIGLTGRDSDSFKSNINSAGVIFEVVPANMGTVENGIFTAIDNGEGYVKCSVGEIVTNIPVVISSKRKPIDSFENIISENIKFSSYPENMPGLAEATGEQINDGQKSLKLKYTFGLSDSITQAAYLDFVQPIEIPENPTALEMLVYGDNSKQWLRGRIIDADGNTSIIDFSKEINWEGWKKVKAPLPSNLKYPIKMDRIYVAALKNDNLNERNIYMDNLQGVYNLPTAAVKVPASTPYRDSKIADLSIPQADSFDITVLPSITIGDNVKPSNYEQIQSEIFEEFKKNSSLGIFAGDANVEDSKGVIKYSSSYKWEVYNNTAIVQMTAKNGGLRNTNMEQWSVFENDILTLNKDHVIIVLDKNPLNFTDAKEKELFQTVMEKIYNTGKNIFVISTEGTSTWVKINSGIRYVNLGSLFNEDGTKNVNFKMLRLRMNGNSIQYQFK